MSTSVLKVSICKAGEDNRAILSIIHDDGYPETAVILAELLKKHGLCASVGLVGCRVGTPGEDPTDISQVTSTPEQDELLEFWHKLFADYPGVFSLIAHTQTHNDTGIGEKALRDEIFGAQTVLRAKFPGERVLTYAYAGFKTKPENTTYTRSDIGYAEAPFVRQAYIGTRTGTCGTFNKYDDMDWYNIKACSLYTDHTRSFNDLQLRRSLEQAKDYEPGGFLVLFFHGILKEEQADRFIHVSEKYADEVFEFVSKNYVSNGIYRNIPFEKGVQYVREYLNSSASAVMEDDKITVRLGASLPSELYDFPLDLRVDVSGMPDKCFEICREDGSRYSALVKTDENGKRYIPLSMVPNGADTVIYVK